MNYNKHRAGGCLCGRVKFKTTGPLRPVVYCHCKQCRNLTGHFMAATASLLTDFKLTHQETLKWHRTSTHAQRGFCNNCGSNMFWQQDGAPQISITAGTFFDDADFVTWGHIFTADKGSYYQIPAEQTKCEGRPVDYPVLKDKS